MKTIEEILELDDCHHEDVLVPEWDTKIRVQSMSADERASMEKTWSSEKTTADPGGFRADLMIKTLKKPGSSTEPLGTPDQIKGLMGKNANAIERLVDVALTLNGFSDKDVEGLEKN